MKIQIPGYKGGIASSLYDPLSLQTFQSARGLDTFNTTNGLTPGVGLVNDAGKPAAFMPQNCYLASDNKYYFLGDEVITAVSNIILYSTTALSSSSSYSSVSAIAGAATDYPLEEFNDYLFWGVGSNLKKYGTLSSGPSVSTATAVTTGVNLLRTHVGLGKLFVVHNTRQSVGYTTDGTTFTLSALALKKNDRIVAIEPYGRFLLVGVRDVNFAKKARVLVWDGASTTVDDSIDLGEAGLQTLRVVNGLIEAIVISKQGLKIYKFTPGALPKEPSAILNTPGVTTTPAVSNEAVDYIGNLLLFGISSVSTGATLTLGTDHGLMAFGTINRGDPSFLNILKLPHTGVKDVISVRSVRVFGASSEVLVMIWIGASNTFYINHTNADTPNTVSAYGTYESEAIALNGGLPGKLKRIVINHTAIPSSCGFTVYIKHFGNYPWGTTVPTPETYQTLFTPEGNASTSGMTQSTNNAMITEIAGNEKFQEARYVQIKIAYDEVSTTNAPNINFPITLETI